MVLGCGVAGHCPIFGQWAIWAAERGLGSSSSYVEGIRFWCEMGDSIVARLASSTSYATGTMIRGDGLIVTS